MNSLTSTFGVVWVWMKIVRLIGTFRTAAGALFVEPYCREGLCRVGEEVIADILVDL